MKLVEALNLSRRSAPADASTLALALVCGFTPLHLQTYLTAFSKQRRPDANVVVEIGVYGDTLGNFERMVLDRKPGAAALVLEWPDFDPRLGVRQIGGWQPQLLPNILETVQTRIEQLQESIASTQATTSIAVSLPTLPLAPLAFEPPWQAGIFANTLRQHLALFVQTIAQRPNVTIVESSYLDSISPVTERLDIKTELSSGFPYQLRHAASLGEVLARLLFPPAAKKGIITDLDDTLWRGLVGEVGAESVSWDLDSGSHSHALYQQMLGALAQSGVLVAIASKNDPAVVQQALQREDMVLSNEHIFPIEASWNAKSEAVERILKAWNVGSDSVVFIDDSPLESAEVQSLYPEMECLHFPTGDDRAIYDLLWKLRELLGKSALQQEDLFRLQSLRQSQQFETLGRTEKSLDRTETFLASLEAELTIRFDKSRPDTRALELVNKTNQFNLNGRRRPPAEWNAELDHENTFLMLVSYKDKFGPLGKIAVLSGQVEDTTIHLNTWVMSCRAFARRIEYSCLQTLFDRFGAEQIVFDFEATPKNGPLRDFLRTLIAGDLIRDCRLSREEFESKCPLLYHKKALLDTETARSSFS